MKTTLRYAWLETVRRKSRAIANIAGYALAVGVMIVLVTILTLSNRAEGDVLTSIGTHILASIPQTNPSILKDQVHEGFIANGAPAALISGDTITRIAAIRTIKQVSPMLRFEFYDPESESVLTVAGIDVTGNIAVSETTCKPSDIFQGRFLNSHDSGQVMLELSFATSRVLPVSFSIPIAGKTFRVTGIVNPGARPGKADVYMPIAEARELINTRLVTPIDDESNVLLIETMGAKVHQEALKAIQVILGERAVLISYACSTPAATAMGINDKGVWLTTIILGIAAITLALFSQYSSVIQRRRDIGILKAIGWSDSAITSQLLGESLIQGGIGGLIGCIAGIGVLLTVPFGTLSSISNLTTITISPPVVAAGFGLALCGGAIAGIYSGMAASHLQSSTILREA